MKDGKPKITWCGGIKYFKCHGEGVRAYGKTGPEAFDQWQKSMFVVLRAQHAALYRADQKIIQESHAAKSVWGKFIAWING